MPVGGEQGIVKLKIDRIFNLLRSFTNMRLQWLSVVNFLNFVDINELVYSSIEHLKPEALVSIRTSVCSLSYR
jgi:hypothetical protein